MEYPSGLSDITANYLVHKSHSFVSVRVKLYVEKNILNLTINLNHLQICEFKMEKRYLIIILNLENELLSLCILRFRKLLG